MTDFHDRRSGKIVSITTQETTNKVGTTNPRHTASSLEEGRTYNYGGKYHTYNTDKMDQYRPKPTDTDSLVRHAQGDPSYEPGEGIKKRKVRAK